MSFAAERATIESHFATAWGTRTPVGFDGHAFTAVKNSVRLTILDGEARQASIGAPGANVARYAGVVAIQIYTEGGKGTATSRVYEDHVSDAFRNKTVGAINFGIPYVSGSLEEPPFLVRTVMVPFTRDQFHA
jgi:hypothetical protein